MHLEVIQWIPKGESMVYIEEAYFNGQKVGEIRVGGSSWNKVIVNYLCKETGYWPQKSFTINDLQDIPTQINAAKTFLKDYILDILSEL